MKVAVLNASIFDAQSSQQQLKSSPKDPQNLAKDIKNLLNALIGSLSTDKPTVIENTSSTSQTPNASTVNSKTIK